MASDVRVGLSGATGALGREILRLLDKAPWRPDTVIPLASERTSVSHVDYGDEHLPVDVLAEQALDDLDVLILAVPPDVAREAGERAIAEGVAVVDCSGVFLADPDVVMVVPWINPEALADLGGGVLSLPHPEAILLASALGPLQRAGLAGPVTATVLVPASLQGRGGIDELSRQVVAMFNQVTPPRKVFPHGLAFDLLPQVGAPDPASEDGAGWTIREREVAAQVGRLIGFEGEVSTTLVGVPVFSGVSAEVQLRSPRRVPIELLNQILTDGGVKMPTDPGGRYLPRPRRVEGRPFAHGGRLRTDDAGHIHLWLAMDNLATAAAAAVSAAGVLVRRPGV